MPANLLRLAAQALPIAVVLVILVLGILAIRALFGSRLEARPERAAAIALAIAAAVALGGFVDLYVASFAGMDSGVSTGSYLAALPYAATVGGLGLLAGLASYVALARATIAPASALGALVGAPLMVGLSLAVALASQGLQNAAFESEAAAAANVIADRSAAVTMGTELLEATMDAQGTALATVRVRVTLKSDRDIAFDATTKNAWPRFTFTNVGQGQLQVEGGASDPQALAAGQDEVWDLTFIVPPVGPYSGTYQAPGPGTWPLEVTFLDGTGAEFNLTSNVEVRPTP